MECLDGVRPPDRLFSPPARPASFCPRDRTRLPHALSASRRDSPRRKSYGDVGTVTVRPPRPSVSNVRSRTGAPSGTETGPVYRGDVAVGRVPSVV